MRQGPALLQGQLKVTQLALRIQVLEPIWGWQFRQALLDGELAFLESRWLKIEVRDLALHDCVTVENGKLLVSQQACRMSSLAVMPTI
ncbi:putative lipid carrier protein [Yersinia pseudotuberculosis]|nr:putative lipid carrier protein [Yersinia pseudotuberculosis]